MKKLLILFFLLITMPSFCQQVTDVSTQELLDYRMDLGIRKIVKKIPEIQIPGQLPNRKFFGNLTTDTLAKAAAKLVFSFTNLNNTSDLNKPLSSAAISALGLKANLASPSFTGNVGIGITDASHLLHLQSANPIIRMTKTGILSWFAGNVTGNNYTIYSDSNNNSTFNITSSGNIGIGTITPTYLFSVNGITNTNQLIVNNTVNNGNAFQATGNSSFAGNVGIGITTPVSKLEVFNGKIIAGTDGGTAGAVLLESLFDQHGTLGALSVLGTNASSGGWVLGYGLAPKPATNNAFVSTTSIGLEKSAIITEGNIRFFTSPAQAVAIGADVTAQEVMTVMNSGRVGIGTINPTTKLQVVGLPVYADNAAAASAGLTAGAFYRTSTGVLMVVF